MDNDLKRMLEGESGTFVIGPLKPKEFLQQVADSKMPGALFARLCLEDPDFKVGQMINLDEEDQLLR